MSEWTSNDELAQMTRDAMSEWTSNDELAQAASLILDLCVKGYLHKGGVAENIGEPDS